ncbi:hypothetical protein IC229_32880 [Spirosoma sp. BT702]|uniref:Uncharacterized protein n=1 Tax=Spirosoma profusum TaxID=2771354 RepID=A0A927AW13_9BACT|nr:hypothetical protein [Spirosoma profusum]MBD2705452.1 hypothetical protein [Spirosoma profusum]
MFAKFPFTATEQDFYAFIISWVGLLAERKYQEAYDSVLHYDYYEWTPELMESIINGYGSEYEEGETKYKVTPPEQATGNGDEFYMFWYEGEVTNFVVGREQLAELGYHLPLNHDWSDLSVTFDLVKCWDGLYLQLKEIHVF